MPKRKFSIVVPMYYEEQNIPHTVPRLLGLADKLPNYELELILVDDGSKDNTFKLLKSLHQKDSRIKVIKLAKNFGSMVAIQAGFRYATGDCVGMITSDLQDPPELFLEMISHWEKGKKVIMAVREGRDEKLSQRLFAAIYYRLLSKFALKDYPKGGFDFVLLDRQVIQELNQMNEKNTNTLSLIYWLGHERVTIPYVRQKRLRGKSGWTLTKKIKLFVDSFVSFSYMPIRAISIAGVVTACLSFLYGGYVLVMFSLGKITVQGYTPLMLVITFLLGLIMVMLGVIGEYLWRILDESRARPLYVVDEVLE